MNPLAVIALLLIFVAVALLWRDVRLLKRAATPAPPPAALDQLKPSQEVRLRALEAKDKRRDLETLKR